MAGLGPSELALILGQEQQGQALTQNVIGDIVSRRATEAGTAAKTTASKLTADAKVNAAKLKADALAESNKLKNLRNARDKNILTPFQKRSLELRERDEERKISGIDADTRDFILGDADIESRRVEAGIENAKPGGNVLYYHDTGGPFGFESMGAFQIPEGLMLDGKLATKKSLIALAKAESIELSELVKQLQGIGQ